MFQPKVILHPTDFSESSKYAYQIALDLARQHEGTLLVLHVVQTLGPENVTHGEAATQLEPESYQKRILDDLRKQVPPPGAGVTLQYLVAEGDPATAIEQVGREHRCDLIVMGTHGHTGLTRLLMGSTAEKVVRIASCPVLTSRMPTPT
jgi:nucleotide-binding universal stress UspA family protein